MPSSTEASGAVAPRSVLGRISLSQVWVAVAVLVPVLVITSTPLNAIDLAYQIRAGDLMLDGAGFLRVDEFTATAAGLPWANQQWLAQAILALTYRAGGWLALALLRALIGALILLLVYLACRARGAPRKTAAWLTLAAGALLPSGFQLRPQLFGMACFAAVVLLLARRERRPSWIWAIAPITAVWANVHGSFFLGPVLLGLAWIEDRRRTDLIRAPLVQVILASLAATLVGPLGPRVWTYAFDLSTDPLIRRVVEEWRPPTIESYTGVVFFLSVGAVAVLLSRLDRPPPVATYLALGVFFAAGLAAIRGVYWWAIAAPVFVAPLASRSGRSPGRDPVNLLNAVVIGLLGVAVVVALAPWLSHADRATPGERFLSWAPPNITRALDDVLEPGAVIYNSQGWGSWFELRFPDNPVTTDARFEVVPDEVWRKNGLVSDGVQGWQAILDAWGADVAALSREQQSQLIPRMRDDPGWRLVYEDEEGAVFTRR